MDEAWCECLAKELWGSGVITDNYSESIRKMTQIIQLFLTSEYEVRLWLEVHGYEKPKKKENAQGD